MSKKIIKDNFEIEFPDNFDGSDKEMNDIVNDCLKILNKKEVSVKDFYEPINSFKSYKYLDKTRQGLEVVKVFEDLRDHRMHIIAHR